MKEVWGCEKKTQMPMPTFENIENEVYYKYRNCPMRFIPTSIIGFMKIYKYYKDFQGASMPSIDNVSGKFILACQFYDSKLNEYLKEKNKNG